MGRAGLLFLKKVNKDEKIVFYKVLKLLSKKNYSENELRNKLNSVDNDIVNRIIEKLKEKGLIDDKKYSHDIVERYLERGKGFYYIINILKRKGFNEEIINQIRQNFDFEKEYRVAQALIKKRKNKGKNNLFLYLKGRGFSSETINKIIER